jgi:hypothetical protein
MLKYLKIHKILIFVEFKNKMPRSLTINILVSFIHQKIIIEFEKSAC